MTFKDYLTAKKIGNRYGKLAESCFVRNGRITKEEALKLWHREFGISGILLGDEHISEYVMEEPFSAEELHVEYK